MEYLSKLHGECDEKAEVEKFSAQIDKWPARSAQLKEETAAPQKPPEELAAPQAEMGEINCEDKAVFH